jgi:hypothetical protein
MFPSASSSTLSYRRTQLFFRCCPPCRRRFARTSRSYALKPLIVVLRCRRRRRSAPPIKIHRRNRVSSSVSDPYLLGRRDPSRPPLSSFVLRLSGHRRSRDTASSTARQTSFVSVSSRPWPCDTCQRRRQLCMLSSPG